MATLQYSVAVRNAGLNARETAVGTGAILKIRTGALPTNCAAADSGTVLATLALPSNWMNDADDGVKTKAGNWEDLSADAAGTAAHFRVYASDGTTCHWQGDVSASGGGGLMIVDNTNIAAGQTITVTGLTLTAPHA